MATDGKISLRLTPFSECNSSTANIVLSFFATIVKLSDSWALPFKMLGVITSNPLSLSVEESFEI